MPPSLSRLRARRAGLLALFCAGVLRVRCWHVFRFFKNLSRPLSVFSSSFAGFVKSSRLPHFRSPVCLLTALRSGCPPWATHLSFPLDMRYRAGVLAFAPTLGYPSVIPAR
jgi:hypothetical protein